MDFADFLLVELTGINTDFFNLSVALVYVIVGHVYFVVFCVRYHSNSIPIKGVSLSSPFAHRPSLCSFYSFSITCFRVPLLTPVTASASSAAENDSCSGTGGYIAVDVLLDSIRKDLPIRRRLTLWVSISIVGIRRISAWTILIHQVLNFLAVVPAHGVQQRCRRSTQV